MCQKNIFIWGGASNPCKLLSVPERLTGYAPNSLEYTRVTVCGCTYSSLRNSNIDETLFLSVRVADTVRLSCSFEVTIMLIAKNILYVPALAPKSLKYRRIKTPRW